MPALQIDRQALVASQAYIIQEAFTRLHPHEGLFL